MNDLTTLVKCDIFTTYRVIVAHKPDELNKEEKPARMLKKIAIFTGGNGAYAMAVTSTLKGVEVNLCEAPEFREGFSRILVWQ